MKKLITILIICNFCLSNMSANEIEALKKKLSRNPNDSDKITILKKLTKLDRSQHAIWDRDLLICLIKKKPAISIEELSKECPMHILDMDMDGVNEGLFISYTSEAVYLVYKTGEGTTIAKELLLGAYSSFYDKIDIGKKIKGFAFYAVGSNQGIGNFYVYIKQKDNIEEIFTTQLYGENWNQDLDKDGIKEIIGEQRIGVRRGVDAWPAFWPIIYKLKDGQFVDSSSSFPCFYEKLYRKLTDYIPKKSKTKPQLIGQHRNLFIIYRYERLFLKKHTAGLEQAVEWLKSENIGECELAILTLQEIGTKKAERELVKFGKEILPKKPGLKELTKVYNKSLENFGKLVE